MMFALLMHWGVVAWGATPEPRNNLDTGLGTAETLAGSDNQIALGVFRPVTVRITPKTDLQTTGLLGSFLSPHLQVKHQIGQQDKLPASVALVASINSPTPVLNLAKGWLYGADDTLPVALQGKVGVLASHQTGGFRLTGGAFFRAGVAAGENDITPRDFYFVDWALAPIAEGPMGLFSLQADVTPSDRFLLTVRLSAQIGSEDGVDLQSRWMALWAPGRHTALGLGFFTHQDQRKTGPEHYFIPGADFQLRY